MAWTAPRTWVTSEVVTASIMNTHVRDNFLETGPAVAASASQLIVADGANSLAVRSPDYVRINTTESTSSTSYTDLTTSGPSITVTTGTKALVAVGANCSNSSAGTTCLMSVDKSGATTDSPSDFEAFRYESGAANDTIQATMVYVEDALTGGSNTFKAQYRVSGDTGTWSARSLSVVPF